MYFKSNKIEKLARGNKLINILLIGIDNTGSKGLTDCLILFSLNPETKQIGGIPIPRDTRVRIKYDKKIRYDKINHVYARGGIDLLLSTVAGILEHGGLSDFTVPFYVLLDYQGFINVVDLLGGVEILIEQEMQYIDKAGDLYIRIPAGLQILDGEKALQFARFRATPGADRDRIEHKNELIKLLADKAFSSEAIFRSPALVKEIWSHVKTNLGAAEILSLASYFKNFSPNKNMAFFEIPGQGKNINGRNYWLINEVEFQKIATKLEGHLNKPAQRALPSKVITVRILNGCRTDGLADKVRERLRQKPKIDVVETGNADRSNYRDTLVIDHVGSTNNALYISKFLGQGKVIQKIDPKVMVDVTVILGQDFIDK